MKKAVMIVTILLLVSVVLNLIWEVGHSMLYDWNTLPLVNDVYFFIPHIFVSTLGDGALILLFALGNSVVNRNVLWIVSPRRADYLYIVGTGLITAVIIEWYATAYGLWYYNEHMPMLFDLAGFSPFVQLALTGVLAVFLTSRLVRSK